MIGSYSARVLGGAAVMALVAVAGLAPGRAAAQTAGDPGV
jgi:hypothetical protein